MIAAPRRAELWDPHVFALGEAPVPLAAALEGLAHQSDLDVPAKLALLGNGVGWLVEMSLRARDAAMTGQRALTAAHAWLDALIRDGSRRESSASARVATGGVASEDRALRSSALEDLLDAASVSFSPLYALPAHQTPQSATTRTPSSPLGYRVTARHGEAVARGLVIAALSQGGVRIRLAPLWLRPTAGDLASRVASAPWMRALQVFALAANARLRLTRLTVASPTPGVVRIDWDVIVPAEAVSERALDEALDALTVAHAVTAPALRALAEDPIARLLLRLHGAPDDPTMRPGPATPDDRQDQGGRR